MGIEDKGIADKNASESVFILTDIVSSEKDDVSGLRISAKSEWRRYREIREKGLNRRQQSSYET